jgi:hypothetical protein
VIRHQALGIDSETTCRASAPSGGGKPCSRRRNETLSSLIAAHDDVVKETGRKDSGAAGYSESGITKRVIAMSNHPAIFPPKTNMKSLAAPNPLNENAITAHLLGLPYRGI